MTRRRRVWRILLGLALSVLISLIWAAWPGSSTYTISPETTFVTGPLDKSGHIDYITALNERLRGDVTPERNANVLIWQALGPRPEGGEMPPEYFRWLGIDQPPDTGDYFINYRNYLKDHLRGEAGDDLEALERRMDRAGKWPWLPADEPELAGWLKHNMRPLAVVHAATRRPDYFNPMIPRRTADWSPGLLHSLMSNVQVCRNVTWALCCRAMQRTAERDFDGAWQDLLTCHRLGRLVGRGSSLIDLLVGIALEQLANRATVVLLELAPWSSEEVMKHLQDLQNFPPMPTVAGKVDQFERFVCLDAIMMLARDLSSGLQALSDPRGDGAPPPPRGSSFWPRLFTQSIDWDPAFRDINRTYDRCGEIARMTDRMERRAAMEQLTSEVKKASMSAGDNWLMQRLVMGPK